ncbi:hypothetical protein HELRODRAFT_173593 [Helobdella robusta]|uniref:Uncharacterized protein n=1 Tax=Helobdella robusta TaxID=6412 RepID=T1F700_HELRO|nr:hypothetical protein HELRODRAFT_173593 [Helobdella robusta]ESO03308.1 hypothetical protein HELRODRAFT_173593 [Helobdella robusta]
MMFSAFLQSPSSSQLQSCSSQGTAFATTETQFSSQILPYKSDLSTFVSLSLGVTKSRRGRPGKYFSYLLKDHLKHHYSEEELWNTCIETLRQYQQNDQQIQLKKKLIELQKIQRLLAWKTLRKLKSQKQLTMLKNVAEILFGKEHRINIILNYVKLHQRISAVATNKLLPKEVNGSFKKHRRHVSQELSLSSGLNLREGSPGYPQKRGPHNLERKIYIQIG